MNHPFSEEMQDVIAHSHIEWSKSKEDIWMEMENKLKQTPIQTNVRSFKMSNVMQYAAAVLVAIVIGFSATAALYTKKVRTDFAQQKSIILPDNSKVKLYANSKLSYKPLLWKFARITHLKGEAFFEVEKGKKFEVVSDKAKTVVLGTQFTVIARNNEYNVDCESGKVMIIESAHKNQAIIVAGEKAELRADNQFKITAHNKPAELNSATKQAQTEAEHQVQQPVQASPQHDTKANTSEKKAQNNEETQKKPVKIQEVNNGVNTDPTKEATKILEESKVTQTAEGQQKTINQKKGETIVDKSDKSAKQRFRNSLTQKQVKILEDQTMSKEEKQKAFMKSLSNEQKELLKEQNKEAVQNKQNSDGSTVKNDIKKTQQNQNKNQSNYSPANNGANKMNGGGNGKHTPK